MQDVFKIKTVNYTYGEVYVNAPLDRESVDRYLLKVRQRPACVHEIFYCSPLTAFIIKSTENIQCREDVLDLCS